MHLEGDDSTFWSFGGFIGDIDSEFAVDVLLHVISFGDDLVFVPVVLFDASLDLGAVSGFSGDLEFRPAGVITLFDDDLFSALGEDAAAFFLVKDTAV